MIIFDNKKIHPFKCSNLAYPGSLSSLFLQLSLAILIIYTPLQTKKGHRLLVWMRNHSHLFCLKIQKRHTNRLPFVASNRFGWHIFARLFISGLKIDENWKPELPLSIFMRKNKTQNTLNVPFLKIMKGQPFVWRKISHF